MRTGTRSVLSRRLRRGRRRRDGLLVGRGHHQNMIAATRTRRGGRKQSAGQESEGRSQRHRRARPR